MEPQIIGAIKIKDALFIGDEFASKDLEFIVTNKVTHIINCAGKQVPNAFENFGVKYLTFAWNENDSQILFDPRDQNVNDIFNFIENATSLGESCLVHSVRGQSRACCILAAFFMKKYKWKLYKTLEFLNSRRPDLEIRASFFHQLTQLEQKLLKTGQGAYSSSWDPQTEQDLKLEHDEKLLRNTFQNSKQSPPAEYWLNRQLFQQCLKDRKDRKIQWADEGKKGKLLNVIGQNGQTNKTLTPQKKVKQQGSSIVKSILRSKEVNIKEEGKQDIGHQIAASKIDSINGNIIHLTVNNYLTPQQQPQIQNNSVQIDQVQSKVNNFFDIDQKQKILRDTLQTNLNSNHIPTRVRRANEEEMKLPINGFQDPSKQIVPLQVNTNSGYRRQNDSLKKHMDDKKQGQYQSPYAYTVNNAKIPTPKPLNVKDNQLIRGVQVPRNFTNNEDGYDRPSSANVPQQDNSFHLNQKRPLTGVGNTRQFSPVVKGSSIPKNGIIVTNYDKLKQGVRYPSPGQQLKNDDIFSNSILLGKPGWK